MGVMTLILSFLISLFSWGGSGAVSDFHGETGEITAKDSSRPGRRVANREFSSIPAQESALYSGNCAPGVSGRQNDSQQRTSSQTGSSGFIKGGKVVNLHYAHSCAIKLVLSQYDAGDSERYLYSICKLRL